MGDCIWLFSQMKAYSADYIPYKRAIILKGEEDDSEELKKEIKELKESFNNALLEIKVCFIEISSTF